ncbi:hypothetical protein ATK74_0848 [Propionicimonas paludicola]|uniref:DUF3846 domain-containing protein n=1 Tax=Propionicimonas paludicola TaxID=185243 RepID=A0A2A9CPG0_9ACTN|nr:hypothetical protein [Propionicimonas paludicola]PFG16314.1 hypothetical protein ATK74_0848 [Propionicimonas paludicola]
MTDTPTLRGVLIPADPDQPVKLVHYEPQHVAKAIGAEWFELLYSVELSGLDLVLVVDEEGQRQYRAFNGRASGFRGWPLVGDVLVAAEGLDDEGDRELTSLTDHQLTWLASILGEVQK